MSVFYARFGGMRICRYIHQDGRHSSPRLGILLPDQTIVDPNLCFALDYLREGYHNPFERAEHTLPSDLFTLLNLLDNPIERLEEGYALYLFFQKLGINNFRDGAAISWTSDQQDKIKLKAPLGKIATYRDFYAHEKHVERGFAKRGEKIPKAWYEIPAYYKGATSGFIGTEEEILWPYYSEVLDYELELAAVISRGGKNIKEMDALDHIFGFTILNDISARDIQKKEMSIRLGPAKAKDFCSIIGPVITTMDEFDFEEPDLSMTAKINGEEWSKGRSSEAHFSFGQMIAHASMDEWILPGDLLGSGTVGGGSGLELDRYLKEGDLIELTVEKIGVLKNKVGRRKIKYGKF